METESFSVSEAPESVFRSVTSEAEVSLDEMLSLACRQGKQDIVELLLESGANVNHRNKAGNTPLLEACSQGHVTIAKLLLDRRADIDAPTETTYDSALTWACTLGNEEIVALLLERKASVEHRTKDGCTALMFAALAGHERVAKLLLDYTAEINVESDSNKDSPLTFACWKGHQKVVELFLERKANIEHRTKEGFSPLMFAALGGHTQVAELLLLHGAQVNTPSGSNNDIPLTSACWKGHHDVVKLLLEHRSNIEHRTKDGCTPLMLAAREGHLTVAELLLLHGAQVNVPSGSENNIPLTLACWKGHRNVVELLLRNHSNIEHQNKAGCTPLMLAAREGHREATQLLLDYGAHINVPSGSNDDTPLTLACWKGHEDVVSLLISRKSNVNHQTKTGCTPLMEATREGHIGVARLLLCAGADVETPDNYGQSPFFMACWKGHADVAALLLEYDANKDCRTKTGITPLFQACRENHVEVVKLLLDYGCNPSTPFPNSRECPLTLAAEKGHTELAQLLLSRNANVESRTKKGCTPFFLASKDGHKDIAIMLSKHGADTEATDHRNTTPLLCAFKNAHTELVEWLLGMVTHLPSDLDCQKALMAPMPQDVDLLPQRSKCLEMIMKAKKAREQAALKNAQILFEELDAEKEKKENKKKAAAKKRSKRKEKKRKEQAEKAEGMGSQICEVDDLAPVDSRREDMECSCDSYSSAPQDEEDHVANRLKKAGRGRPVAEDSDDQFVDAPLEHYLPVDAQSVASREPRSAVQQSTVTSGRSVDKSTMAASVVAGHDAGGRQPRVQSAVEEKREKAKKGPQQNVQSKGGGTSGDSKARQPAQPKKQDKNTAPVVAANQKNHVGPGPQGSNSSGKGHQIAVEAQQLPVVTGKLGNNQPSNNKGKSVQSLNNANHVQSREVDSSLMKSSGSVKTRAGDLTQKQLEELSVQTVALTSTSESSLQMRNHSKSPCNVSTSVVGKLDSSQSDSSNSDWGSEEMEAEEMRIIAMSRTDDDKLRSQHMKPNGGGGAVSRPLATAGAPTSAVTTTSSSATQSWQEVTRTTRSVQLTISNALVGRIIGVGGVKINNIQEVSGAQINISRGSSNARTPERIVTIKGTQRAISKAQEMIEEAISHPDKELEVLPLPHSRSLTSSPFDTRNEDTLITRSASPNHGSGKGTSDVQSHIKPVNPSPAASRKMPLPVCVPSTVSESSRYLSTDSSTTVARSGIESVTTTQTATKGFSEAVVTSRPFAWAPKRQEDLPSSRAVVVEMPPNPPPPPAPVQSIVNGSSWSSPPVTSATATQPAVTTAAAVAPSKNTQTRCKSSEPMETETLVVASTEVQTAGPRTRHSRSFSDPAGALDVVPAEAPSTEPGSLPLGATLKTFVPNMPTIISPRVSGQESDIVGLHESMGNVSGELEAAVEPSAPAPAKESSENKRPDGKEASTAVSSSGAGEPPVPKTTKTVAVITPTPHTFQPSSVPTATSAAEAGLTHTESSTSAPFGVIGPPRRSSVPSNTSGRSRKLAYGNPPTYHPSQEGYMGCEFTPERPEPFFVPHSANMRNPADPSMAGPQWLSSIPEADRARSYSWAGAHPGVHPSGAPQVVYFAKPGEDLLPPGDGDQWLDRNSQTGGLYGPVGSVGYNNVTNHAQRMQQGMGYGGDYSNLPPPKHNGNMWAHPPGSPLSSPTVQSQGFQPHQVGGAQDLYRPQFISSHPLHQSDLQRAIGTPHDACAPGPNAPLSFEDEQSLQSRKRWSVPNYSYPHQPTFHPLAETQGWGPGYIPGRPAPMDRENVRGGGFLPPQQQPSGGMWSGWSVPVGPPGGAPPPPRQHPAEFQGKGNAQSTRVPPSVVENWNKKDGTLELQQLMKSLDISEHLPVLRDRKLSLQQLYQLTEEEWRSLKLPVGPRVKLMKAVSNMTPIKASDVANNRAPIQPEDVRMTEINSSGFSHAVTTTSQAGSGMFQGHFHGAGLN